MSGNAPDPRLDALLRDLPAPPVPAGLAARVREAAAVAAQEPRLARARRATRRDRRGGWLRRPLLAGTAAIGLLVTSAVAATLAGVPIPQKLAAVFFPEEKAPSSRPVTTPRPAPRAVPARSAPVQTAEAEAVPEQAWADQPGPMRRLAMLKRMVAARRAMGLPTPGADRLERRLRHRAELWEQATPEQRTLWLERQRARREARREMLATPEGQASFAAQQERMRRWRAQREAGLPPTPEQRAAMRDWRERRMAGLPLTPEERAMRQERMRAWRAEGQTGRPPPTEEQRLARQERFRQWREARRARWQARHGQTDATAENGTEGPETAGR